MKTCFVNRGRIARPEGLVCDMEVPSLSTLADQMLAQA
jgi:hypothetical protein